LFEKTKLFFGYTTSCIIKGSLGLGSGAGGTILTAVSVLFCPCPPEYPLIRSNPFLKFPVKSAPIWKTLKTELKILAFFFSRGLDFLKPNIYIIQV
jgi:hypothetical protein